MVHSWRRSATGLLVLASALVWTGQAHAQPVAQAKCEAAQIKCAINAQKGYTTCNANNEKKGIDDAGVCASTKVTPKLLGVPGKPGCIAKTSTKVPCLVDPSNTTAGQEEDTQVNADTTAFATALQATLHGSNTISSADLCSAAKDKCVTNYVKGILTCNSKIIVKGVSDGGLCVGKVQSKFNVHLSTTACLQKNDLTGKPCNGKPASGDTFNDSVQAQADAFIALEMCSLTAPPTGTELDVTTANASGTCGNAFNGGLGGSSVLALDCGGTYVGDGAGSNAKSGAPANGLNRYAATCNGPSCSVGSEPASGGANTCTDTGCPFGLPRPQPNTGTPVQSSCVLVAFTAPASGSANSCHGSADLDLPLQATVLITGNLAEPCPLCVAGHCDNGANNPGAACTNVDGMGASYECQPKNIIPPILITLSTPNNSTDSHSVTTPSNNGIFCPSQAHAGCFGTANCDAYTVTGSEAGPLTPGAHPADLAAVFCVPATGNSLIDSGGGFPGPGAQSQGTTLSLLP
jgi:hypothetical protein